jgi:hypothetical protein
VIPKDDRREKEKTKASHEPSREFDPYTVRRQDGVRIGVEQLIVGKAFDEASGAARSGVAFRSLSRK